ncbi:MAG: hypothetical protein EpisKO_41480 [Epibacterium sp.]
MTNYSEMTPEARYEALDQLATRFFETSRWKTRFAERYGFTRLPTLTDWSKNGAPAWACVALEDALKAKALETVRDTLRDVIDGI